MKNNPQRNRERTAAWRKLNPEEARNHQLWHKFGLTRNQYDDLLKLQLGVCAICSKSCISGRALAVDHCHTTKKIRGLLCMHCNQGLGMFRDSVELLDKAKEYLKKYGS